MVLNWLQLWHSRKLQSEVHKGTVYIYHTFFKQSAIYLSKYEYASILFIARMFSPDCHHITKSEIATGCEISEQEFTLFLKQIYDLTGLDFCLIVLSVLNWKTMLGLFLKITYRFFWAVQIAVEFGDYLNHPAIVQGGRAE